MPVSLPTHAHKHSRTCSARGSGPGRAGQTCLRQMGWFSRARKHIWGPDVAEVSAQAPRKLGRTEVRGRVWRKRQSDGSRCSLPPCQPPPLALCPSVQGFSPWKPRNAPQLPINCLCPHLLGDASGRLGRRENLFPDPIQRRGLPVRDLHSHRRHRLQGEVAAGSASRSEQGCGSGPGHCPALASRMVAHCPEGTRAAPGRGPLWWTRVLRPGWLLARCRI